jgi:hypothetical protein
MREDQGGDGRSLSRPFGAKPLWDQTLVFSEHYPFNIAMSPFEML